MKFFEYTVQNPIGLHARPASALIMMSRAWQSEIIIEKGQYTANPKSLLSVLALNVNQGDRIRITVEGLDEEEAIAELEAFLRKNL